MRVRETGEKGGVTVPQGPKPCRPPLRMAGSRKGSDKNPKEATQGRETKKSLIFLAITLPTLLPAAFRHSVLTEDAGKNLSAGPFLLKMQSRRPMRDASVGKPAQEWQKPAF